MPLHHIFVIFAYVFFAISPALGMSLSLIWPAFLTLPFALFQIFQVRGILPGCSGKLDSSDRHRAGCLWSHCLSPYPDILASLIPCPNSSPSFLRIRPAHSSSRIFPGLQLSRRK